MSNEKYTGTDYYCDVALKGEMVLKKEYESENVLAYHHTNPLYPIHIVVIPKKHIGSFITLSEEDMPIYQEMVKVIQDIARQVVDRCGAARILTNLGMYQDSKHLHFHVNAGDPIRPPVAAPKINI